MTIFENPVHHVDAIRPFCSLLLSDLSQFTEIVPARVAGSVGLVRFFNSEDALRFADHLLSRLGNSVPTDLEPLLMYTFDRLATLPSSPEFDRFWIKHFFVTVQSSSNSNEKLRQSADRVLIQGSSSLLLSSTSMPSHSRSKSTLPFAEWTKLILSLATDLSQAQATVLSGLVSRSAEARQRFLDHIQARSDLEFNQALELPLKSLLEVAVVRKEKVEINQVVSKSIINSILSREVVEDSSLNVVELLSTLCPEVDTAFWYGFEAKISFK